MGRPSSTAPPAAAYAGQCGGNAADYTEAPGANGSVVFVLARLARTGTETFGAACLRRFTS